MSSAAFLFLTCRSLLHHPLASLYLHDLQGPQRLLSQLLLDKHLLPFTSPPFLMGGFFELSFLLSRPVAALPLAQAWTRLNRFAAVEELSKIALSSRASTLYWKAVVPAACSLGPSSALPFLSLAKVHLQPAELMRIAWTGAVEEDNLALLEQLPELVGKLPLSDLGSLLALGPSKRIFERLVELYQQPLGHRIIPVNPAWTAENLPWFLAWQVANFERRRAQLDPRSIPGRLLAAASHGDEAYVEQGMSLAAKGEPQRALIEAVRGEHWPVAKRLMAAGVLLAPVSNHVLLQQQEFILVARRKQEPLEKEMKRKLNQLRQLGVDLANPFLSRYLLELRCLPLVHDLAQHGWKPSTTSALDWIISSASIPPKDLVDSLPELFNQPPGRFNPNLHSQPPNLSPLRFLNATTPPKQLDAFLRGVLQLGCPFTQDDLLHCMTINRDAIPALLSKVSRGGLLNLVKQPHVAGWNEHLVKIFDAPGSLTPLALLLNLLQFAGWYPKEDIYTHLAKAYERSALQLCLPDRTGAEAVVETLAVHGDYPLQGKALRELLAEEHAPFLELLLSYEERTGYEVLWLSDEEAPTLLNLLEESKLGPQAHLQRYLELGIQLSGQAPDDSKDALSEHLKHFERRQLSPQERLRLVRGFVRVAVRSQVSAQFIDALSKQELEGGE